MIAGGCGQRSGGLFPARCPRENVSVVEGRVPEGAQNNGESTKPVALSFQVL